MFKPRFGSLPRLAAAAFLWLALAGIADTVGPPGLVWSGVPPGAAQHMEVRLPGLSAPAEVHRDQYGIPHIYARSTEDAYFVLGYLHATDRLLQMELFRRRASGTLAEIFGKPAL